MPGPIGFSGSKGDQGDQGFVGSRGLLGYTGSRGEDGSDGESIKVVGSVPTSSGLDPAYTGAIGDGYVTADTGHLWVWDGATWIDVGQVRGYSGSIGPVGSRGATGFTGSQGGVGLTGSQGDIGFTGSRGDQGITGFTGSEGTGFTGSEGDQGLIGFTGSAGLDGLPDLDMTWDIDTLTITEAVSADTVELAGLLAVDTEEVYIGLGAGLVSRGGATNNAVALGNQAGTLGLQDDSIAIGRSARASDSSGIGSVSIGALAGSQATGNYAVNLGYSAGVAGSNFDNTIVLNATGTELNPTNPNGLFVKPVREFNTAQQADRVLLYDTQTGEVTYGSPGGLGNSVNIMDSQSYTVLDSNASALLVTYSGAGDAEVTMPATGLYTGWTFTLVNLRTSGNVVIKGSDTDQAYQFWNQGSTRYDALVVDKIAATVKIVWVAGYGWIIVTV